MKKSLKKSIAKTLFMALALCFVTTLSFQCFANNESNVNSDEWWKWYNSLSEEEKLAVSYTPSPLVPPAPFKGINADIEPPEFNFTVSVVYIENDRIRISVPKGGKTIAGSEALNLAKDKNLPIMINTKAGYRWTILPQNINQTSKDVNLDVEFNTNNIPKELINSVTKLNKNVVSRAQFTVGQDGEDFGFSATLEFKFNSKNAGKTAKYYFYDTENETLKLIGSSTINDDGRTNLRLNKSGSILALIVEE